ncbi:hypothetical protein [Marivirga arenosa]|uniref:Uncharacterized protein n=1 Tax=Marivirga arenosa TaxID=3059076 RepID=A0AA49GEW8_9BACT|nr:hypothetical protein [Marivirga sp. BKB1-2]WKK81198.2 hypothetical protein QYS47_02145 [Marivirga sp. BKB1-2]
MIYNLFIKGFTDGGIRIENEIIQGEEFLTIADFQDNESNTHIVFKNCTFLKKLSIDIFNNSKSKLKKVKFHNCKIIKDLEIYHCKNSEFSFSGSRTEIHKIDIFNCYEGCKFDFNNISCSILDFTSVYKEQFLKIFSCNFNSISLNGTMDLVVKILGRGTLVKEFVMSSVDSGNIEISESQIDSLVAYDCFFTWLTFKGKNGEVQSQKFDIYNSEVENLNLDKIQVNFFRLNFVKIIERGNVTNSKFVNEAYFQNLDFTKLNLNNLDFFKLKELSFSGSTLNGGVFQAIKWPETYFLKSKFNFKSFVITPLRFFKNLFSHNKFENSGFDLIKEKSLAEQYRQLKVISQNNGDRFSSLQFYQNEMNSNLLIGSQDKSLNGYDRFLLKTNKWFSNFGLDYFRPLIWLLFLHTFIFTFMIISGYNSMEFIWPWNNSWYEIGNSVGYYFYLINPLHKLPSEEIGVILGLDFISRIVNSYFIFYILKATRKFTFN